MNDPPDGVGVPEATLAARLKAERAAYEASRVQSPVTRVTVTDFDMPFGSMIAFMLKWALAAIPAMLILIVVGGVATAMLAGVVAGLATMVNTRPSASSFFAPTQGGATVIPSVQGFALRLSESTDAERSQLLQGEIARAGRSCAVRSFENQGRDGFGPWAVVCAAGGQYVITPSGSSAVVRER